MTGPTLQNAFEACQTNKAAWMNRKAELAATELEYRDLLL
ncbi:phage polarity suppression protein, partial [Klebsiella aerogenes]